MEDLERKLQSCREDAVKLIVVDGVFSMEGDLAIFPNLDSISAMNSLRIEAGSSSILSLNPRCRDWMMAPPLTLMKLA